MERTVSWPVEPQRAGSSEGAAFVPSGSLCLRLRCLAAGRHRLCAAAVVYGGTEMINAGIISACPPTPVCSLRFRCPATGSGSVELCRVAPHSAGDVGIPSPAVPVRARACSPDPAQPLLLSSAGAAEGCSAAAG